LEAFWVGEARGGSGCPDDLDAGDEQPPIRLCLRVAQSLCDAAEHVVEVGGRRGINGDASPASYIECDVSQLGALVGRDVDNQGPLRAALAWVTALKVAREGGDPVPVVDHVAVVDVSQGEVVVVGACQVLRAAWGVRLVAFGAGDRGVQDANVDKARNTAWVCESQLVVTARVAKPWPCTASPRLSLSTV